MEVLIKYYKTVLIVITFFRVTYTAGQSFESCSIYPDYLVEFIDSMGMHPITDEEFLYNKQIYGGSGLPYVEGVFQQLGTNKQTKPLSVLFWSRKKNKTYLVFAINDNTQSDISLMLIDSIPKSKILGHSYELGGSLAMTKYGGELGTTIDLSNFHFLDNPSEFGPKNIFPTLENGFLPVIQASESSTTIYYRYSERWLIFKIVDW